MKLSLTLGSLLLVTFFSCRAPYKNLMQQPANGQTVYAYQPVFDKALYRCIVDGGFLFKKYHISGVLFFKQLENGTKRVVFQNELGPTLFDFEWDTDEKFKVNQAASQLNRESVIKTLQKDFEMLLMIGLDKKSEIWLQPDRGNGLYSRLTRGDGFVYYLVDNEQLKRIDNANNRKRIVTVDIGNKKTKAAMPDKIKIEHHKARFTITLVKLESDVNE